MKKTSTRFRFNGGSSRPFVQVQLTASLLNTGFRVAEILVPLQWFYIVLTTMVKPLNQERETNPLLPWCITKSLLTELEMPENVFICLCVKHTGSNDSRICRNCKCNETHLCFISFEYRGYAEIAQLGLL